MSQLKFKSSWVDFFCTKSAAFLLLATLFIFDIFIELRIAQVTFIFDLGATILFG